MRVEHLSSVSKVAEFLGTPEDAVLQLLSEGRLGGVLIATLARRGVPITPGLKNTVATIVQRMDPRSVALGGASDPHRMMVAESTITIMFTDIVESTSLTQRLGDRRARELLRQHDAIVRQYTRSYGGIEVKSMGDGFMLTFQSARRGVGCAVAIQQALDSYNQQHLEAPIAVRMGLSVGEPIREEKDLFGMPVILAARISALARGGQILICQTVRALIASLGEFRLRETGEFQLKGVAGSHTLYEVIWRQS